MENQTEYEEKKFFKYLVAEWNAYRIYIRYKLEGKVLSTSYDELYATAFDKINYDEDVQKEIFLLTDELLSTKYHLLIPHNEKNIPINLVDILERN